MSQYLLVAVGLGEYREILANFKNIGQYREYRATGSVLTCCCGLATPCREVSSAGMGRLKASSMLGSVRGLKVRRHRRQNVASAISETLYHRDDALLYIAYVMLIWAAPIPADRWHCSLWP